MFKIRDRKNVALCQLRSPMVEIATNHELLDQLPLNEENWAERWCTLPIGMKLVYERVFNFKVRDDDIFLLGFTKCGNTWLFEALWQLMNGLDFNYTKLKENQIHRLFLELNGWFSGQDDRISLYDKFPGPRLLQSHLPANLLPKQYWEKKPKTIYVARNVKDVVISSYHFNKGLDWLIDTCNMDEYVQGFINDNISFTPYWAHIVNFWKLRNEPYVLFITYEEMKRDLAGVIKKICIFLEIPALTESELKALLEHLSFEKMKEHKMANPTLGLKRMKAVDPDFQFMRRGIVGGYKDELSVENQNLLNDWSLRFLEKHGIKEEDIFGSI